MARVIDRDLQSLRQLLITLFKRVEEMVRAAILALKTCDLDLARRIIRADDEVDNLASYIFEQVNITIALKQPTARDLRLLTSMINLSKDLERIADQAVNLAEIVPTLFEDRYNLEALNQSVGEYVEKMETEAWDMLSSAINAFMGSDIELAEKVMRRDANVDHLYRKIEDQLLKVCEGNPALFRSAKVFNKIVENFERIADLSVNICEESYFVVRGERIKFQESVGEWESERLRAINQTLRQLTESLQNHIVLVCEALKRVPLALEALRAEKWTHFEEVKKDILEIEEKADKVKRAIRGHLPRGLILPVDKFEIFQYLKEADSLADFAEELLLLLDMRTFHIPEGLLSEFTSQLEFAISQAEKLPEIVTLSLSYLNLGGEEEREKAKELIRSIRNSKNEFIKKTYEVKKGMYTLCDVKNPFQAIYYAEFENKLHLLMERIENSADLLRAMIAKI